MIFGHHAAPFGIRARVSADGGTTWGPPVVLRDDGSSLDLGYTRSVVRSDGKIVTAYYYNVDSQLERSIEATIIDPDVAFGARPEVVADDVEAPDALTGFAQVDATTASVTVDFTDVADPLINHLYSTDDGDTWCPLVPAVVAGPVTIRQVSAPGCAGPALTANTAYPVAFRALNAAGPGDRSTVLTVTTSPAAPTRLSQAGATTAAVVVAFARTAGSAPLSNHLYSTDNGATWCALQPSDRVSPVTVTKVSTAGCAGASLRSRTNYSLRFKTVNGPNSWNVSSMSAAVAASTIAAAPTGLSRTGSTESSVSIAFTAPPGSAQITNYQYSTDNGTTWCASNPVSPISPVRITNASNATCNAGALVANRTYPVRLRAVGAGGNGVMSASVAATTLVGAPESITGNALTRSVALAWSAPSTTGGVAITDYVIQYSKDNVTWTTFGDSVSNARSVTVTGLTKGQRYFFRVAAKTSVGRGAFGATTRAFTPT